MEIARHIGVTQPTISLDLREIQKQWRDSAIRDFDVLRERELKKIERVEREAWAAWERSRKPAQSAVVNVDGRGQKTQKKLTEQCGDPRYLDQIQKCIAGRRALLGLDAPTRIAPVSPDGQEAYHSFVMSELMRLAQGSKEGPDVIDAEVIDLLITEQKKGDANDRTENQEARKGR